MKRLILVLLVLMTGLSKAQALEYDAYINGKVTVEDMSATADGVTRYIYQIKFDQTGLGRSDSKNWNSSVCMIISPDGPSIAGTYSLSADNLSKYSYVQYGENIRYVLDYSSTKYTEFTIADNGDGSYTLSGVFRTNKGTGYYYYFYDASDPRNTFVPTAPDPFESEPEKSDFTFDAFAMDATDCTAEDGSVLLDLYDADNSIVELKLISDKFALPAGTYTIDDSGDAGTIQAASGAMDSYYPKPSFVYVMKGWDGYNYFIRSGSVTVSYSADGQTVNLSGTLTTAHGSTVTLTASVPNPFKTYEPKTYTLDVTEMTSTVDKYMSGNPYLRLDFKATDSRGQCDGFLVINTGVIAGEYGYLDMGSSYLKNSICIYGADKDNTITITPSGKENEYRLSARLAFGDEGAYDIYLIENAVFTYVPPILPGPFDAEDDKAIEIDMFTAAEPYIEDFSADGDGIRLGFYDSGFNIILLDFAVDKLSDILPGRYIVSGTKEKGTLIASEGRHTGEYVTDEYETYSYFGAGMTEEPYYITEGYVDVAFTETTMMITGRLGTYKGSIINVDIKGVNNGEVTICPAPLPLDISSGHLLGTDDATYTFAFDLITDDSGYVTLHGSFYSDKALDGLKATVIDGGEPHAISIDPATGACSYKRGTKSARGEEVRLDVSFQYEGGTTSARSINYVVE